MLDEIKKGLLSGLGAVFLTKDKIEKITRSLVEEAKMSKEDAQNLREDLYKTGEKEWSELEDFFSGMIKKIMQSLNLCNKKEVDELKKRIEDLEKRLGVEGEQIEKEN